MNKINESFINMIVFGMEEEAHLADIHDGLVITDYSIVNDLFKTGKDVVYNTNKLIEEINLRGYKKVYIISNESQHIMLPLYKNGFDKVEICDNTYVIPNPEYNKDRIPSCIILNRTI